MTNKANQISDIFLDDLVIPIFKVKPIYSIKEVSDIIKEKQYVIRYWESEFGDIVKPMRGRGNRRLYKKSDIETLLAIRHLLKNKKFTIQGAKKILKTRYLRESIQEEVLTPTNNDKIKFLSEQIIILIEEMERIKNNLLNFKS